MATNVIETQGEAQSTKVVLTTAKATSKLFESGSQTFLITVAGASGATVGAIQAGVTVGSYAANTGVKFAIGQAVYYGNTADELTTVATNMSFAGIATAAKGTTGTTGSFRLMTPGAAP